MMVTSTLIRPPALKASASSGVVVFQAWPWSPVMISTLTGAAFCPGLGQCVKMTRGQPEGRENDPTDARRESSWL